MQTPDDRCPRCGVSFHCGMNGAAPCPCSTLALPPALLAELRSRYTGCLCLACLRTLASRQAVSMPLPPQEDRPWD